MTVRWKPLLILSGLFVVVALVGVVAIIMTLAPRSSQGTLKLARAAQEAGRFADAEIHYKQALQIDGRSAAIYEEFAGLYREWARQAPAEKQAALRGASLGNLVNAVKFDKTLKGPRKLLLQDAMVQDLASDSVLWAKELLSVEPEDADAHYALAAEALEERTPNVPEIKRHLDILNKAKASSMRRLWIRARLADLTGDDAARTAAVAEVRATTTSADPDPVDRFAQLRLTALEIRGEPRWEQLSGQVARLLVQVKGLGKPEEMPPTRVARLRFLLEQTQKALTARSAKLPPDGQKAVEGLVAAIEVDLDSVFQQALAEGRQPDLQTYWSYADHLRFRRQPDRCLAVIHRALQTAQAQGPRRTGSQEVMGLHTVATEMILARVEDAERFTKVGPHIQALLDCQLPRFQAFGHLFAGSIDLDRSGLAREAAGSDAAAGPSTPAKLRTSALVHLKAAATAMPNFAEAQARYGVALVLAQEPNLGRQYLQNAMRLGSLEPQYQLWAAWTILQAGYPEEAEPIVRSLLQQVDQGNLPRDMEATLHLLRGELYQARRSPDDLKKAVEEFDKALAAGQATTPTAIIRLAQIDVQLGRYDQALKRLQPLRSQGKGGEAAEQLAILILQETGKKPEALALLRQARSKYPRSAELAGLDASLRVKDKKPKEADQVLEEFLRDQPDTVKLVILRAQIQAEELKNLDKARELLRGIADRSDSSDPWVQLASLELEHNRLDEAATIVAQIRTRWREAAVSDILDAQIAIKQGKLGEALEHFNEALKKDPENKIVQLWKAQLDGRTGAVAEAAKALEDIVRDKPVKEVDTGTTLLGAAQSALANLSFQTRDFDDAIRRFEKLKQSSQTVTLSRRDRWMLISAYINKGQWPLARREIASILNDSKQPPTAEERVSGANYYRQQGEIEAALAQIDYVLRVQPTNPSAVVTRSLILLRAKQHAEAAAILQKAIELALKDPKEKPPAVFYLMLAAVQNETPPAADALKRALKVLDTGLEVRPTAYELVQAKYLALVASGDSKGALAFVETKARENPKGPFRRLLVEKYREQKQYDLAEQLLTELHQEFPDESNLAAALVQVVSLEAAEAGARNQADRQRQLNDRATAMIGEFRTRYPKALAFLHAECEMAARDGDFTRAIALTYEIDKAAKTSILGPLLRARLFTSRNKLREVAEAYAEALEREREPRRQLELRILLGQTQLKNDQPDEALRQANMVLDNEKNRPDALLLWARAMTESGATSSEKESRRREAIARLEQVIKNNPTFSEAYHTLAEIHLEQQGGATAIDGSKGNRATAIAVLKADLQANPDDGVAAGQLVQLLAERRPGGQPPVTADLAESKRIADDVRRRDDKGRMILAMAIGFHRAGQLELALPLAREAADKLDTPAAHLNFGDLLLAIAESQSDHAAARETFERAVQQYVHVLKVQPNSVEAANNKAWILHTYLDRSQEALELVMDLRKHVSSTALPGEFFDTLGTIQESIGQTLDAEQSYLDGLKKSPENPALNFHFGRLLAADRSRVTKAKVHLNKALLARERLNPTMAHEAELLVRSLNGGVSAN
jgi:tetratricopeptide (TPR) repeat protein